MDEPTGQAGLQRKEVEGERRIVTILFTDVQGSTSLAEQLDPEEWAEIMNAGFDYLIKPVYRYEGKVARLMGDGILAFFGAPIAHEDDPQRAILAGLEIVAGIQPFREQLRREFGLDFNVRVGINTGSVVVGEIGSEQAGEYTAMGDAVNLASRLEQIASPGSVQVGEETYRMAAAYFDFEPLGTVEVRGKSEPVQVYRAVGVKTLPGRARGIPGLASPLVGREREFASLEQALADLRLGRGSLLALVGDAGLGKSRLIEEIRVRSSTNGGATAPAQLDPVQGQERNEGRVRSERFNAAERDKSRATNPLWVESDGIRPLWVESRGISYDMARPYSLFQQHFRLAQGVREDDPAEVIRERVAASFSGLDPEAHSAIQRAMEALLALREPQQASNLGQNIRDGEALKREIFSSLLELWRCLAERYPVVLVFDDLHWADPASVDLLLHLFQLCDQVSILFLCAFRPVRSSSGWRVKTTGETEYPHRYTELTLSPLSESESGALVDQLLAVSALPAALRVTVMRKSEGNPFFLEELVRTLIESGAIRRDEQAGRWVADPAATARLEISLPENLQALLAARIDRLKPAARRALQLASVIGRSFNYRVLQAIAVKIPDLDQQMVELERAGLVREAGRLPELEYSFRHELTRDAAYNSILRRQRREHHRAVGQAIEQLYPDRLDSEAHRLATHFEEARDFERALDYSTRAADHAYRLHASQEASMHYRRALDLALRLEAPTSQLTHLYTRLGRNLELIGRYDQAQALYRELHSLGKTRQDPHAQLAALLAQATVYAVPSSEISLPEGRALALEALGMARELADQRSEARALWVLMLIEHFSGADLSMAVAYGEKGLEIARQLDLREERAYILNDISRPYYVLGRLEDALLSLEEANQLWNEMQNLPMVADSLATMAEIAFAFGDLDQTERLLGEALQIGRKIDNPWAQAYSLLVAGQVHLERGQLDQAFATFDEALVLGERGDFLFAAVGIRLILFFVYCYLGDSKMASELIPQLERLTPRMQNADLHLAFLKAMQTFYSGQVAQAAETIAKIESVIRRGDFELYYGTLPYFIAVEVELANHKPERALELIEARLARLQTSRGRAFLPDLLHQRARARLSLGQAELATQDLLEARAEALKQGSRRSLWPILADLVSSIPDPNPEFRAELSTVLAYLLEHLQHPRLRAAFQELPNVKPFI